jgi:hypothetical protein
MKNNKLFFWLALLFTLYYSNAVNAEKGRTRGVQQTYINDRFGEITDEMEIPCACQFDRHRSTAPRFLSYGEYLWACMKFDTNGFCLETERFEIDNFYSNSPISESPQTTVKLITTSEINGIPVVQMDVIDHKVRYRPTMSISDKFGDISKFIPFSGLFDIIRKKAYGGLKEGKFEGVDYIWSCKVFDQYGLCREVKRISKRTD